MRVANAVRPGKTSSLTALKLKEASCAAHPAAEEPDVRELRDPDAPDEEED